MTIIYIHAFFALMAVPLGLYIFLTKKGTAKHKYFGRICVAWLFTISVTAVFIQEITPGEYSFIHLLIPLTIGSLIYSIWSIRKF